VAVLAFLIALPLAVSSIGALLRLRDDADPAEVFLAVTWRTLLLLALVWATDHPLAVLAAFVTVLVLQLVAFYGTRAFPIRR